MLTTPAASACLPILRLSASEAPAETRNRAAAWRWHRYTTEPFSAA
jgi:hypothetical protein